LALAYLATPRDGVAGPFDVEGLSEVRIPFSALSETSSHSSFPDETVMVIQYLEM